MVNSYKTHKFNQGPAAMARATLRLAFLLVILITILIICVFNYYFESKYSSYTVLACYDRIM